MYRKIFLYSAYYILYFVNLQIFQSVYLRRILVVIYSAAPPTPVNPCQPSPCGPNSQCKEANNQAICSCLSGYHGAPPSCKPECVVNAECASNLACVNLKCTDPCVGTCGINAECRVIHHSPICSCKPQFTGDPFARCFAIESNFFLMVVFPVYIYRIYFILNILRFPVIFSDMKFIIIFYAYSASIILNKIFKDITETFYFII